MAEERRPALRISDAERERAVRMLGEHHAVGRLTYEEFVERMDQAYEARTHEQLDVLTADLPTAPALQTEPQKRRWLVSVLGGNERAEDVARDETVILDVMGGSDLDLRGASFPAGEATVTAIAIMGGSTIWVPEGARVELSGFALMGGNSNRVPKAAGASGPLVRVKAWSLMGGVDVRSGSRRSERKAGLPPPGP
jgi:Domain of unknown function (DUF1707)